MSRTKAPLPVFLVDDLASYKTARASGFTKVAFKSAKVAAECGHAYFYCRLHGVRSDECGCIQ